MVRQVFKSLAGLCLIALLIAGAAYWHGDAAWIMSNPATVWCCGPEDCLPAYQGEIERRDDGWFHVPTGTSLPFAGPLGTPGVYINDHDAQVWRCVYAGRMRCVFLPLGV